jgi:hypothetical protein
MKFALKIGSLQSIAQTPGGAMRVISTILLAISMLFVFEFGFAEQRSAPKVGAERSTVTRTIKILPAKKVVAKTPDRDRDGVADNLDNCPARANRYQLDIDFDGKGDVCDPRTLMSRDNVNRFIDRAIALKDRINDGLALIGSRGAQLNPEVATIAMQLLISAQLRAAHAKGKDLSHNAAREHIDRSSRIDVNFDFGGNVFGAIVQVDGATCERGVGEDSFDEAKDRLGASGGIIAKDGSWLTCSGYGHQDDGLQNSFGHPDGRTAIDENGTRFDADGAEIGDVEDLGVDTTDSYEVAEALGAAGWSNEDIELLTGLSPADRGDDDGDGIPNGKDDDMDGDGIPNSEDDDIDGDGVPNDQDCCPRDSSRSIVGGGGGWGPIYINTDEIFSSFRQGCNKIVFAPANALSAGTRLAGLDVKDGHFARVPEMDVAVLRRGYEDLPASPAQALEEEAVPA